ncbi:hypothetical protein EYF80_066389 [Liparis tanakae]|uniref:MADF domain-containing protein n=1 Tax=Liparis tanakae TaxID=230148 RepID=A0A4Z2E4J3_9TELE|nr:hypothetical protein EYF80_066389 [Liparis tanakae]
MINVVITVSGMWLRRDVKAAYIPTRVFIKERGLGTLDPKLVKKRWENLVHKYKELKKPRTGVSTEGVGSLPLLGSGMPLWMRHWGPGHL